jgi:hypothetical protein
VSPRESPEGSRSLLAVLRGPWYKRLYPVAIFTLNDSHTPPRPARSAPVATSESRAVVALGVSLAVIIGAVAISLFALIYSNIVKFATVDNSNSSVTVTEAQTTYTNPKYGVTLKLPAKWEQTDTPRYQDFCRLSGNDGLFARFRPFFPMLASPDQFAEGFTSAFVKQGWTLVSDSRTEINGRTGHITRFEKNFAQVEVVVVRKGPVMYELLISGSRRSSEWSRITDALPQSIEVK